MITTPHLVTANQTHLTFLAALQTTREQNRLTTQASCPTQAHTPPPTSETDVLYVATNLKTFHANDPGDLARDLGLNGTCYRRLDPVYYAWLHSQVTKLKQAGETGKLSAEQVAHSLAAFREIHTRASARFGQAALNQAVRHLRTRSALYKPPSMDWLIRSGFEDTTEDQTEAEAQRRKQAHLFPPESEAPEEELPCWTPVFEGAVEKIRAIEAEALTKGWTQAGLYQNRGKMKFPFGDGYGLVCFVKAKDRIGRVEHEWIEIVKPPPGKTVLRFPNSKCL